MHSMTRSALLIALAVVVALPARAQDTDEPIILSTAFFQCDWNALGELVDRENEVFYPLAQEVVDSGDLIQAGMAVHDWGDELNLMTWTAGYGIDATLGASRALNGRYQSERTEAADALLDACPTHTDQAYVQASTTEGTPSEMEPGESYTLVMGYYSCPFDVMGEIKSTYDRVQLPFAQELVDEGQLRTQQLWFHVYGDEWTVLVTTTADDLPTYLAANDEMNRRIAGAVTDEDPNLFQMGCTSHKDNIYTIVGRTN